MKYTQAIATLYEGHYDLGVGALINSLSASGFKGVVFVGYRGTLPEWREQLTEVDDNAVYQLTPKIEIRFCNIEGNKHLTFVKPYFVMDLFLSNPDIESIFYFDPDIVANAPWDFFSDWVEKGICLCLDTCFSILPHNHPWRHHWLALGGEKELDRTMNYYVNAGFFGLKRTNIALLEQWIELTDNFALQGGDVTKFTKGDYLPYRSDQDILNAVLTCYPNNEYSMIGTEGMGFTYPAYVMSHAVGGNKKPWVKNCLVELLIYGKCVTYNERRFFENCEDPIQIFKPYQLVGKKINLKIATILGRLIGK